MRTWAFWSGFLRGICIVASLVNFGLGIYYSASDIPLATYYIALSIALELSTLRGGWYD